jgi:hypothetical protein
MILLWSYNASHVICNYYTGIDSMSGNLWVLLLSSQPLRVDVEVYRRISKHLVQHFNPSSVKEATNRRSRDGNIGILLNPGE